MWQTVVLRADYHRPEQGVRLSQQRRRPRQYGCEFWYSAIELVGHERRPSPSLGYVGLLPEQPQSPSAGLQDRDHLLSHDSAGRYASL